MQHQFCLDARTSHILLCHCARGLCSHADRKEVGELKDNLLFCMSLTPSLLVGHVVALLDCIEMYGLPGAKGDISTLSDNRRHDFSNLRRIIYTFIMSPCEHLKAQRIDLRLRALATMERVADGLISDMSFVDSYTARPHRCSSPTCICSGMKAPHKLRICKGCLSVFYCNKWCQKR